MVSGWGVSIYDKFIGTKAQTSLLLHTKKRTNIKLMSGFNNLKWQTDLKNKNEEAVLLKLEIVPRKGQQNVRRDVPAKYIIFKVMFRNSS